MGSFKISSLSNFQVYNIIIAQYTVLTTLLIHCPDSNFVNTESDSV